MEVYSHFGTSKNCQIFLSDQGQPYASDWVEDSEIDFLHYTKIGTFADLLHPCVENCEQLKNFSLVRFEKIERDGVECTRVFGSVEADFKQLKVVQKQEKKPPVHSHVENIQKQRLLKKYERPMALSASWVPN